MDSGGATQISSSFDRTKGSGVLHRALVFASEKTIRRLMLDSRPRDVVRSMARDSTTPLAFTRRTAHFVFAILSPFLAFLPLPLVYG